MVEADMGQVRLVASREELEGLSEAWRLLGGSNLMRSWDFQRCWLEHFASRDALRVLVSEESGRIEGILPLVEQKRLWTGRTLINFGSGKACLDDLGIIASHDRAPQLAREFASFLLHSRELVWDYLDLEGIRTSDAAMQVFGDTFSSDNPASIDRRSSPSCWALELKPDRDGYHSWPKRLRSMMRKAREERQNGELEVKVASTREEAAVELKVLESIHQARWQDRGIQGCFSNESFLNFTHDLVGRTCEAGRSFVATLRWQGSPAASAICFLDCSNLYVYLASMSPEFPQQKPGWKLNGFLADYALQCGCKQVDFMRGDEEYKQRMGALPSTQERWMIASPKFWGKVHRTLYRTAREIKHFITVPTVPAASAEPSASS